MRYEVRDNQGNGWYTCHIWDTEENTRYGDYVSHFHARQVADSLNYWSSVKAENDARDNEEEE